MMTIPGDPTAADSRPLRRGAVVLAGCSLAAAMLAGHTAMSATIALAACHHFTVKATPASVPEGGKLTITVSRDANLAPSNVDVSTVDETAKAGQDYVLYHKTFSFTNETQKTDTVQTVNDQQPGSDKTLRLHLSSPGGCAINPNYVLDPDARVTVQETTVAVTSASPNPASTLSPTPATSTQPTGTPNTGPSGADHTLVAVSIGALLIVVAGGWLLLRRRVSD